MNKVMNKITGVFEAMSDKILPVGVILALAGLLVGLFTGNSLIPVLWVVVAMMFVVLHVHTMLRKHLEIHAGADLLPLDCCTEDKTAGPIGGARQELIPVGVGAEAALTAEDIEDVGLDHAVIDVADPHEGNKVDLDDESALIVTDTPAESEVESEDEDDYDDVPRNNRNES